MFIPSNACRTLFLAALLAGPAQAATTYIWPSAAPCNGLLQACIDATANGDRIEVASATINEDISVYDRDLTLVAAPGFEPVFGAGHWASVTSSAISGNRSVSVGGLSFRGGYFFASYGGTGTATLDLRDLVFDDAPGVGSGGLQVYAYGGTVNATLYRNRVTSLPPYAGRGIISFVARGGTLNAEAYYNRVQASSSGLVAGGGIVADYSDSGSGGRVRVHGNEVRGSFGLGGIVASEGIDSAVPVSFDARVYNNVVVGTTAASSYGIRAVVNTGTINWQAAANTITQVEWGLVAGPYSGASSGARVDGFMSSNLVRASSIGLYVFTSNAPSLTNDYNLINAPSLANVALGSHTLSMPAKLVSDELPRLSANSPAIDAADTNTVGLGMLLGGLPFLDADGLRRMKTWFALDRIDIGAYEYGDASFAHLVTSANTSGHVSTLRDPAIDGVATAHPQVTQNYSLRGVLSANPFGTWLAGSAWTVFIENFVAPPNNLGFDVFSPAPGAGVFRHVADASNSAGATTRLDDSSINDLPDRMLFVTQDFGDSGPAAYNPHDVGVRYVATSASTGYWVVANLDQSAMPAGAGFSVYAQTPGPNAFRVTKVAGVGASNDIPIDHALLDGIACAQPIVTRVDTGSAVAGGHYDVYFNPGSHRWAIYGYEAGGIAPGTPFNVLVNPAQVAACIDRIFADGFD